jgi:hypothetical protein
VSTDFFIGQTYNRRRDIHARFGGQRQSGIVTPSKYPAVFVFTGRGAPHGYADEWSADGTFRYFGEGQKGDMTLTKGNKAIANHAADGKDLLLFDMLGGGRVRFRGPFNCAGYSFEDGKDHSGNIRKAYLRTIPAQRSELAAPWTGARSNRSTKPMRGRSGQPSSSKYRLTVPDVVRWPSAPNASNMRRSGARFTIVAKRPCLLRASHVGRARSSALRRVVG